MNDSVISGKLINKLAGTIHELRPDWTEPGIIDALAKASKLTLCADGWALVLAAVRAANDGKNRTPAVIALDGRHWHAADEQPLKPWEKPAFYGPPQCSGCGERGHDTTACPSAGKAPRAEGFYQRMRATAGLGPRERYVPTETVARSEQGEAA